MHNERQDLNPDSTASRRSRRNAATVAAGVIALAVAAAAVLDERAGRTPAGSDPAESGAAPVATAPTEARSLLSNATSSTGAARPHFERADEPAYTSTENPHGG